MSGMLRRVWNAITNKSADGQMSMASGGIGGITPNWTSNHREQVYHFRTWVYRGIDAIASHMGMDQIQVAYKVNKKQPGNRAKFADRWVTGQSREKSLTPLKDNDELEAVPEDHPLCSLFANPNDPDTQYSLIYELIMYAKLTGDGYLWAAPNGIKSPSTGQALPGQLWALPSHWMREKPGQDKWVEKYDVTPDGYASKSWELPPDQVIRFSYKNPLSKRDGQSPLAAGDHWIDTCDKMDQLRLACLVNGAFPTLGVEFNSEKYKDPDDPELRRILANVSNRLQGLKNAGGILFKRPESKVDVLRGVDGLEMGFLNSYTQMRDMILSLLGVPYTAAMIVGGATHENYDESMRAFHQGTINPLKRWFGQVLTEKLAARYDERLVCYWKDTTPIDRKQENDDIATRYDCFAISPNEIRKRDGLPPWPEAWADQPGGKPPGAEPGSVVAATGDKTSTNGTAAINRIARAGTNGFHRNGVKS